MPKQSVPIAVIVQLTSAMQRQSGLGVSFRVEFDELDTVGGHIGKKLNKMHLRHGVMDGDKLLIFHVFYGNITVPCFRFQRR